MDFLQHQDFEVKRIHDTTKQPQEVRNSKSKQTTNNRKRSATKKLHNRTSGTYEEVQPTAEETWDGVLALAKEIHLELTFQRRYNPNK